MASTNHMLVIAAIFFCLYLHHVPVKAIRTLDGICTAENVNSQLCNQVLGNNPQATSAKSAKNVADVALGIAKADAEALKIIFQAKAQANPAMKVCADSFNTASLELNLRGLKEGSASLDVHYALDACVSCETALKKSNVKLEADVAGKLQHWKGLFNIAYAGVLAAESST